jgi:hypothetical protein
MIKRLLGLTLATTAMLSVSATAAPERERIRGTVSSVSADTLAVHTTSGEDVSITLGSATKYLQVEKASLGDIEKDSYIGTATKSVGSMLVALEVVIFPPAMKGTGDGHYAWDTLPDSTVSGGGKTASMMTNGNVASVAAPAAAPGVNSSMTNGNVAATTSKDGTKELTVAYKGGQQTIIVPPTAPIVMFKPGTVSDVTKGASVFINAMKDEGKITANAVAVGVNGVKPPM